MTDIASTNEVIQPVARRPRPKFAIGNPGGPGNPHIRTVAALRKAFLDAVKPEHVQKVLAILLNILETGKPMEKIAAGTVLLDRCLGRPLQTLEVEAAIMSEQSPGFDISHLSSEERETLRQIKVKVLNRSNCSECQKGNGPCPDHR